MVLMYLQLFFSLVTAMLNASVIQAGSYKASASFNSSEIDGVMVPMWVS